MTIPSLSNDKGRCEDGSCPERHRCLRWLRREDTGHVYRTATLRPFRVPSTAECPARIPYEGDEG